jgi:hypothetical protein
MLLLFVRDQTFAVKQKGSDSPDHTLVIERKSKGAVFLNDQNSSGGPDLSTQVLIEKVCSVIICT